MKIGDVGMIANAVSASIRGLATANSGTFVVNHDNVLAAAKIIQNQVDVLKTRVDEAAMDLQVVPPGNDRVSGLVAKEWNKRLLIDEGCYAQRVKDYTDGLDKLVTQLRDSALAYGYNEDEVAAALGITGD
ncbi:hypothetical protein ACTG9Q_02115 [Actinokineospora sp. 24-640]